jgi:predicted DNA-binding antitoxin AbrB/MazE fold protein
LLKTIKARYKDGVIEPLEKIDIADDTEMNVTIDVPSSMSEEERWKRFLSSAGGWKDIVDEDFLDEIYRQRSVRNRPEVKL